MAAASAHGVQCRGLHDRQSGQLAFRFREHARRQRRASSDQRENAFARPVIRNGARWRRPTGKAGLAELAGQGRIVLFVADEFPAVFEGAARRNDGGDE